MREFLKGLDFDDEMIDTIMAEYGKSVTRDKEEINSLRSTIVELKQNSNVDWKTKYDELNNQVKKQNDDIFESGINKIIGDKTFVNDYTRNSVLQEVKEAYNANSGKSVEDIFNEVTNGKQNLFINDNHFVDMPDVKDVDGSISKEAFDKMSYNERLNLKRDNPELFAKYNN